MTAAQRRQEIMNVLISRRFEKVNNLAAEFGISEKTVRTDIAELSLTYPIETVQGRYGGGIKLAEWFWPNRKTLTPEQIEVIKKAAPLLSEEDRPVLMSILTQFTAL